MQAILQTLPNAHFPASAKMPSVPTPSDRFLAGCRVAVPALANQPSKGLAGRSGRSFLVAMMVLFQIVSTVCAAAGDAPSATAVAEQWLGDLDKKNYPAAWKKTDPGFRRHIRFVTWKDHLRQTRHAFGCCLSRHLLTAVYKNALPGYPLGKYAVIQYESAFENQGIVSEYIVMIYRAEKHWSVINYHLKR